MKKLFFLLAVASTLASCSMTEYYNAPEIIMLQSTDSSDVFQVSATNRPDTLFEDVIPVIKKTGTRSFVMWHSNWDGSEGYETFPVYRVEIPYASCERRARSFYEGHFITYLQDQMAGWKGVTDATPQEVIEQLLHGISEGDYIPWEEVNFPK